jgi:hypothetical protein
MEGMAEKASQIDMWRCSAEDAEHLLLLFEHRVGFGRHVWCLLDITRPAGGEDLNVRLHKLIPRHLDVWDWTLLRYLGFPVALAWGLFKGTMNMPSQTHDPDEASFGFAPKILLYITVGTSLLAALVVLLITGFKKVLVDNLVIGTMVAVPTMLVISFIELILTAKKPLPDMVRHSSELQFMVTQEVNLVTVAFQVRGAY